MSQKYAWIVIKLKVKINSSFSIVIFKSLKFKEPPVLPIVVNHPQQTASAIVESKLEENVIIEKWEKNI